MQDLMQQTAEPRDAVKRPRPPDPGPEIRQFDAADDGVDDGDSFNLGLSAVELSRLGVKRGPDTGSIVIRTMNGPMRISTGYSVYAVELDGEDEVVTGQQIAGPGLRVSQACVIAHASSFHPDRFEFAANFVIVNDGNGKTFEKFPMLRIAA